jgi:hypothetical protein
LPAPKGFSYNVILPNKKELKCSPLNNITIDDNGNNSDSDREFESTDYSIKNKET